METDARASMPGPDLRKSSSWQGGVCGVCSREVQGENKKDAICVFLRSYFSYHMRRWIMCWIYCGFFNLTDNSFEFKCLAGLKQQWKLKSPGQNICFNVWFRWTCPPVLTKFIPLRLQTGESVTELLKIKDSFCVLHTFASLCCTQGALNCMSLSGEGIMKAAFRCIMRSIRWCLSDAVTGSLSFLTFPNPVFKWWIHNYIERLNHIIILHLSVDLSSAPAFTTSI